MATPPVAAYQDALGVVLVELTSYLTRRRNGRRNAYRVHMDAPLRHDLALGSSVADLIEALGR